MMNVHAQQLSNANPHLHSARTLLYALIYIFNILQQSFDAKNASRACSRKPGLTEEVDNHIHDTLSL